MVRKRLVRIFLLMQVLSSCRAQEPGCTDPLALNYSPSAVVNDGSCSYAPVTVSPLVSMDLDPVLEETSGLVCWDDLVWTHNDNTDTTLYGLDGSDGHIEKTFALTGVVNNSWEEISQDKDYLYLGDFGNNDNGNRTDLHLLRIAKKSLQGGDPQIDTLWFSYADQTDLEPAGANATDFDCEAFIVSSDSIYLFTKQWVSLGTQVYRLPKIPGTHVALKVTGYPVEGLITGATWFEAEHLVVLCGYTSLLSPFLYLLYDFEGTRFFSGNKRRVSVSLPFHQVEGVASTDGTTYYLSNEYFEFQSLAQTTQMLHIFHLEELLGAYLEQASGSFTPGTVQHSVYPNPAVQTITVRTPGSAIEKAYCIVDMQGRLRLQGKYPPEGGAIDVSGLTSGTYFFVPGDGFLNTFKFLKF
jgi:hypothetical protein